MDDRGGTALEKLQITTTHAKPLPPLANSAKQPLRVRSGFGPWAKYFPPPATATRSRLKPGSTEGGSIGGGSKRPPAVPSLDFDTVKKILRDPQQQRKRPSVASCAKGRVLQYSMFVNLSCKSAHGRDNIYEYPNRFTTDKEGFLVANVAGQKSGIADKNIRENLHLFARQKNTEAYVYIGQAGEVRVGDTTKDGAQLYSFRVYPGKMSGTKFPRAGTGPGCYQRGALEGMGLPIPKDLRCKGIYCA